MNQLLNAQGLPIRSDITAPALNNQWYHWANFWSGMMLNPDLIPMEDYERMEETDETVFSGLEFLKQAVLSRLGEYEHPDENIQAFVRKQFEQIQGSLKWICSDILTGLQYGFSLSEIIWKKQGKSIGLKSVQTLHPATIDMDLHREGEEKNTVSDYIQFRHTSQEARIPKNKVIHFVHRGTFGNPFGKSRLKRAYKSWWMKDKLLKIWGICQERYGTPIIGLTAPSLQGTVQTSAGNVPVSEWLGKVVDSVGTSGSLILPQGTTFDIKYAPGGLGADFDLVIRYLNRSIHQAIGLPSLIADNSSTGSYSLGQAHSATFDRLLEEVLDDLIECLLEQLVRPLIEYNFGQQDTYGDFAVESFDAAQALLIAQASTQLVNSGVVDTERLDDINRLREMNNFPPLTQEDLSPAYPEIPIEEMSAESAPVRGKEDFTRPSSLAGKRSWRLQKRFSRYREPLSRELIEGLQLTA